MSMEQLRAKQARRFKATTDSSHGLPVAPNHLNRQFKPERVDAVWASDITYIWTREGWLYLAVVMDLFSRRIIGWSMRERLEKALVTDALRMALSGRRRAGTLVCHSDRGGQYASHTYRALLQEHGIVCSMSRKGNCWDNAVAESFFSSLKRELVHHRDYGSRERARREVFEYIEVFYNRKRRHSSLGYMTPVEYEIHPRHAILTCAA
jgi:transposase InsO family protein